MLKHRLICLFLIFSAHVSWAEDSLKEFSNSPVWQRLYQYKNNKSKIESQFFFFSKEGMEKPYEELLAAIDAYKNTSKSYGILQLSAACAFPARKKLLETKLGLIFPKPHCKDLDAWIQRIDADQMAINFAGAYSGNPASILGHTFLRYYKDGKTRQGQELLSHAVGFLAVSPPEDSRAMYMIRGLTGQYPGYYQIEPFYMKVGIYNNSESRDIWEQKLNLTPDEVEFSLQLLWEYSFNSKIPYYFIDENCSYRLLSLLEVIRPNSNLISKLSPVVLPADTVRVLIENKMTVSDPKFRSSILRRLKFKVDRLNELEKSEFESRNSENPIVLDALIDYWTYTNYRAETKLKAKDSNLMEETFLKRAKLSKITIPPNEEELRAYQMLQPTYLGHKTSWASFEGGSKKIGSENQFAGKISYRMGAHALTDAQSGYDDIATIEYLGFDIKTRKEWSALLIDAKSIEPINAPEKKWSWLAKINLDNDENDLSNTRLILKGGGGGAYGFSSLGKFYFMPALQSELWIDNHIDGIIGLGFESGFIFHIKKQSYLINNEYNWNRINYSSKSQVILSHHIKLDHSIFVKYELEEIIFKKIYPMISEKVGSVGYKIHF